MRKAKITRRILKPWVRIFIILILSFFAFLGISCVRRGTNPNKSSVPSYTYNIKKDISYKVFLKPNDFYEEKYLGENLQYTSELIDYITIDFDYLFNGSKQSNFNYTYDITATIIGEYENTSSGKRKKKKKKYILSDKQNITKSVTNNYELKKSIDIKYDDYNNIVNDFKSKFNLGIDAYLNVKLKVDYINNIIDNNTTFSNTDYMEINIPLNTSAIRISTNNLKEVNRDIKKEQKVLKNPGLVKKGYIILSIDILFLALFLPVLFSSTKSLYMRQLRKIMKNYSEVIVEIESLPNFDKLEFIDIKEFDDMIDLEEETKSPILFYEDKYAGESWFIIIINKYVYKYVLRK